jgi:hypothetical protein
MGVMKRIASQKRSYTGNFSGVQGRFDINLSIDNTEFVAMCERLRYEGLVRSADIRKVFARVAKPVRVDVQRAARSVLGRDRRKAWKGVRVITLKKGKGVVVGLLNPRKAGNFGIPPKPTGRKSGIRRHRKRSDRTNQVDAYQGADRSFILRMHNQGTDRRIAGTRDGNIRPANRGQLTARRFFDRAEAGMQRASQSLAQELGKIIEQKSKKS